MSILESVNRSQAHLIVLFAALVICGGVTSLEGAVRCVPNSFDASCDASDADIQSAINNASAGDTVFIAPGTYTENIDVTKRLIIRGSGSGSDDTSNTIITAAAGSDPTVQIQAGGTDA